MDLVILAAGMGSRFGGNKQAQPIDENGNYILHYSCFDAVKAGFDRVVLIIRKEHQALFENTVCKRLKDFVPVTFAYQSLQDVPQGVNYPLDRVKPWGTAHALYSCKDIVSDRFAVINADDFYGRDSFKVLANFLKKSSFDQFVSVGYKVKNTLPDKGVVKRGIFELYGKSALGLVESRVEKRDGKIFATPLEEDNWQELSPETMVSMTVFGFSKKIFDQIEDDMKSFFSQDYEQLKTGELLLTTVVGNMLNKGTTMDVLPTKSKWYGITYRDELDSVKAAIKDMRDNGEYPQNF